MIVNSYANRGRGIKLLSCALNNERIIMKIKNFELNKKYLINNDGKDFEILDMTDKKVKLKCNKCGMIKSLSKS